MLGGGYNALTKILAANSEYTLLDIMAHGGSEYIEKVSKKYNIKWLKTDWYTTKQMEDYDIIVANDIFPDVDQRLELFIERMLPHCRQLRLVLTYYNKPCFYTTKRIDDSEIMTFLSWDGEITALKLRKYFGRSNADENELNYMAGNFDSIFYNGRQVSYITIRGEL